MMTTEEEYEKLRSNILSVNPEKSIKTIMVLSSVNGEGSTTVASNLARNFAKDKSLNILLAEINMKKSALDEIFNIQSSKGTGFNDLVYDNADIDTVLKKTDIPNLSIIANNAVNDNNDKVCDIDRVSSSIKKLEERFDYMIFDSAPVSSSPDVHLLASRMDGVILVVHAEKTRWEVVQNAKQHLEKTGTNIIGVVLNRRKYIIPQFIYKRL